jgi:hypothetical protein
VRSPELPGFLVSLARAAARPRSPAPAPVLPCAPGGSPRSRLTRNFRKRKYPEEKAVPQARRRLQVSSQEVVEKALTVQSTTPIPELDPKLLITSKACSLP